MLKQVNNFSKDVPEGKFGFAGFRWGVLFVLDSFFRFSQWKKKDGKVIKKLKNPTPIGKIFRSSHKSCIDKLLKENKGKFQDTFDIPTIDSKDFDKEFFDNWRKHINMPIVIKGYIKDAPIRHELNKENLIKERGNLEVQCVTVGDKEDNRVGQNIPSVKTTLEDFLTQPKFEDYYINNFYGIVGENDFKEKCKGKELDEIQGQINMVTHWFISRSSSVGSSLHCAGGENMFLNIVGKKQWDFIHPSYSPILQPTVSKYGTYAVSEMTENFIDDPHEELSKTHPHMQNVPFYRCVLEEGDMLYNPAFWWHTVRNLTHFNIGCATRYWASAVKIYPISLSMIFDMIKHPQKSSTIQSMKILKGKLPKSVFNDIVFANSDKRKKKHTEKIS